MTHENFRWSEVVFAQNASTVYHNSYLSIYYQLEENWTMFWCCRHSSFSVLSEHVVWWEGRAPYIHSQSICVGNSPKWRWEGKRTRCLDGAAREVNIQFPSLSFVFPMFLTPRWQPHATANLSSLWDLIFQKTQHEHLFKCLIIGRNAAVFIIVNSDLYDVPIQTYLRVHLRI